MSIDIKRVSVDVTGRKPLGLCLVRSRLAAETVPVPVYFPQVPSFSRRSVLPRLHASMLSDDAPKSSGRPASAVAACPPTIHHHTTTNSPVREHARRRRPPPAAHPTPPSTFPLAGAHAGAARHYHYSTTTDSPVGMHKPSSPADRHRHHKLAVGGRAR